MLHGLGASSSEGTDSNGIYSFRALTQSLLSMRVVIPSMATLCLAATFVRRTIRRQKPPLRPSSILFGSSIPSALKDMAHY